jgi:hypothetical protein
MTEAALPHASPREPPQLPTVRFQLDTPRMTAQRFSTAL